MPAANAIDITAVLTRIRTLVVWPILFGLATIMLIYAGILFLLSAGDPSKVTKARAAALWAMVGIAVGLLAYGAEAFIRTIIGA